MPYLRSVVALAHIFPKRTKQKIQWICTTLLSTTFILWMKACCSSLIEIRAYFISTSGIVFICKWSWPHRRLGSCKLSSLQLDFLDVQREQFFHPFKRFLKSSTFVFLFQQDVLVLWRTVHSTFISSYHTNGKLWVTPRLVFTSERTDRYYTLGQCNNSNTTILAYHTTVVQLKLPYQFSLFTWGYILARVHKIICFALKTKYPISPSKIQFTR